MKYFTITIIFLVITSCGKDDNENDNSFEFNLDNSYRVESLDSKFETPNAYEAENINEFNVLLTDSEIGNELSAPCCGRPWDYIVNPNTVVQIYFSKSKSELRSGIYTYNKELEDNDFEIYINNQMTFDSNNNLISFNEVANKYSSNSEIKIDNAQIELLLGQMIFELNYIIETSENKRIVGSYIGSLASFTYNFCNADCD